MALDIRVTALVCGYCRDGNHPACPVAIASTIPHAQNRDGIVWVCPCSEGGCESKEGKCTDCNNRVTEEVDLTSYKCFDREACEATQQARRDASPHYTMIREIRKKVDMAKVENATKTAAAAKKAAAPKVGSCVCCGGETKGGLFLPGHDARFVSQRVAAAESKNFTKASVDAERKVLKDKKVSDTLLGKFDKAIGLAKTRVEKSAKDKADKAAAKAEKANA